MAKGNKIIVSPNPKGIFREGPLKSGITPKPGTVLQIDASAGIDNNGNFTYELADMDGDGDRPKGPLFILLPDQLQGKTATDAYASGERCYVYTPIPGEEFNMLVENQAGTADDHPLGEMMVVDDGTGKLIVSPGSGEEIEPFMNLEASVDPTADALHHVIYTGY